MQDVGKLGLYPTPQAHLPQVFRNDSAANHGDQLPLLVVLPTASRASTDLAPARGVRPFVVHRFSGLHGVSDIPIRPRP
jgi:hypothetical protein